MRSDMYRPHSHYAFPASLCFSHSSSAPQAPFDSVCVHLEQTPCAVSRSLRSVNGSSQVHCQTSISLIVESTPGGASGGWPLVLESPPSADGTPNQMTNLTAPVGSGIIFEGRTLLRSCLPPPKHVPRYTERRSQQRFLGRWLEGAVAVWRAAGGVVWRAVARRAVLAAHLRESGQAFWRELHRWAHADRRGR